MPKIEKTPNLIEVIKEDLSKLRKNKDKVKKVRGDRSGLWAKIGFGLGVVSAGAWLIPVFGLPVSIIGIVFNILGLRAEKRRWFAVAGLTLTIVFLNLAMTYTFYAIIMSMLYGG